MGCCSHCPRLLLIIFNFIFWLSGAAILAVGIWILVDPEIEEYQEVITDATDDDQFLEIAAYILIAFGALVFLVGFCGCCGAIRSSKCLIGLYITFLILVFAGELAAGIYVAIYSNDASDKLDEGLTNSIKKNYKEDSKIASAWDAVQEELECCGGHGYMDYNNSMWMNSQAPGVLMPKSCCILDDDGQPKNLTFCQEAVTNYYWPEGCRDQMEDWIEDHSRILIAVGCGIAALEIIGLVCAIYFCRNMDKDKYSSN
ncbi:hypothetical protein PoB_001423100 [Plakobranchus ocellatus]|uniref:Tetraspanin n=1 Tax=Plakobranchus ocellatus TaxID=259542 RepID=A0AAV3YKD8_9GAST|nr:hypothetical protein PoB_001423100 [Plakobranchus ocellatus]